MQGYFEQDNDVPEDLHSDEDDKGDVADILLPDGPGSSRMESPRTVNDFIRLLPPRHETDTLVEDFFVTNGPLIREFCPFLTVTATPD